MDKLFEWIKDKKNRKRIICGAILIFFVPPIVLHSLYKIPHINQFFKPEWSAGEFLNYMGAFYTLVGTTIFSCLALYLNYLQRVDNKKAQKNSDTFNTKLLNKQDETIRLQIYPYLTFSIVDDSGGKIGFKINCLECEIRLGSGTINKKEEFNFNIEIKNIGLKPAINFTILDIEYVDMHDMTRYGISRIEESDAFIIPTQIFINIENMVNEGYRNVPVKIKFAYTDIIGNYYEQFVTVVCNWVTKHDLIGQIGYGPCIATIDKNDISDPVYYGDKKICSEEMKKFDQFSKHQ